MFVEDKDFNTYRSMYEIAREFENKKQIENALEIYLNILAKYEPKGTLYYERPIVILEKLKRYEEALNICYRVVETINRKRFNATVGEFENRIIRLKSKINKTLR